MAIEDSAEASQLGLGLPAGGAHYRAYVGPPEDYDLVAAMCFGLLTAMGLRGHHSLLDVGCGSLRLGRLLIPYLNTGNYHGLEPNPWLIDNGVAMEVGQDLIRTKKPSFYHSDNINQTGRSDFFDFAIAQSIFSHCGPDLLTSHLHGISGTLKVNGILLATYVPGPADSAATGWVYPECVDYTQAGMAATAQACGFVFHAIDWLHPRQRWALFAKPGYDASWLLARPLGWNTWLQYGPK